MGQSSSIYTSISSSISNAWNAVHSSTKKLSSGLRINSAGDDAAGLAVRESLRADIATTRQGSRNASAAISMMQTADAAAEKIGDNLIRMKELATQASGGTLTTQQKKIVQKEFDQLAAENNQIADTTTFNGKKLFTEGETTVALGGDLVKIKTEAIPQATADLVNNAPAASETVDTALSQLNALRGSMGSMINQIETATQTLDNKAENIMAAESRISDVDVAKEIATLTNAKVRSQVAAATQVHANMNGSIIASLLGV
jgi:flagellin